MPNIHKIEQSESLIDSAASLSKKKSLSLRSSNNQTNASGVSNTALSSMAGNFNQFLTLLTTQLKHQDPSNPTNTDNFTSELAQFAGVQQQVEANTRLSNLISATQDSQMITGIGMVGKKATATSSLLPLQESQAAVQFSVAQAGPVAIAITNASGKLVKTTTINAKAGDNTWDWNGIGNSGQKLEDGQYSVAIEQSNQDGKHIEIPTQIIGKITGLEKSSNGINLKMGRSMIGLNEVSNFLNE